MTQLSTLLTDLGNKKRWPHKQLDQLFDQHNFYYYPKYSMQRLRSISSPLSGPKGTKLENGYPKRVQNSYCNLDYKFIVYSKKFCRLKTIIDTVWYLVTDIDQNAIAAPLNICNQQTHPGGKRLAVARYLNLPTVPVLLQTQQNLSENKGQKLNNPQDLIDIYGKEISVDVVDDKLEVSWHGQSQTRDPRGYDGWMISSRKTLGYFSVWEQISNTSFNVFNTALNYEIKNKWFSTRYTTDRPQQGIYLEILDSNIDPQSINPWELFFHIDPTVQTKTCKTGKYRLVNMLCANKRKISSARLADTLQRPKNKFV